MPYAVNAGVRQDSLEFIRDPRESEIAQGLAEIIIPFGTLCVQRDQP